MISRTAFRVMNNLLLSKLDTWLQCYCVKHHLDFRMGDMVSVYLKFSFLRLTLSVFPVKLYYRYGRSIQIDEQNWTHTWSTTLNYVQWKALLLPLWLQKKRTRTQWFRLKLKNLYNQYDAVTLKREQLWAIW